MTSPSEIYSPGLEGVIAGETAISTVTGGLRYRGYPVTELAEKATFDEVAFLLLHGELPTTLELREFQKRLATGRQIPDTLRHFRLANPPHPFPQFFETFFVLQEPTFSSIYPVGQGMALALGIWLGLITERAGSALPAVAAHVINNVVFTVLTATVGTLHDRSLNMTLLTTSAVLFFACVFWIWRSPAGKPT